MYKFDQFSLPYVGMNEGLHKYSFEVDDRFFRNFENSLIKKGLFKINLEIYKTDRLSELSIFIEGVTSAVCDRCLSDIMLPVKGEHHLIIKPGHEDMNDVDVIFVDFNTPKVYLDQIFYELICLSLPMSNVYDCENDAPRPCNDVVLKQLSRDEDTDKPENDDIWSELKGIIKKD